MFKSKIRGALEIGFGLSLKVLPVIKGAIIDKLTIFVFHDVTDTPSEFGQAWGLTITNKLFREQISWISENFNIIHPNDLSKLDALPNHSAVLTFDDGFAGTFRNGIPYLVEESIPSITYLNMGSILNNRPIISAQVDYLDRYLPSFSEFAEKNNLARPYFLTITPTLLNEYKDQHGPFDLNAITKFQGPFAGIHDVQKWCDEDLVMYGNHLFDHWNSAALIDLEFKEQYLKNAVALEELNVTSNYFAFTNGQPGTCFGQREIKLLQELGAERIFYSSGYTNSETSTYLLDRIGLSETDNGENYFWFRMLRLFFNRNKRPHISTL